MSAGGVMLPAIALLIGNAADRRVLASFLKELGYPVISSEPMTADARLLERASLVIVDEQAAQSAVDLLLALKERLQPVVLPALVAVAERSDGAHWLRRGFDDLLRMPLRKHDLLARIEASLRLRRQSEESLRVSEAFSRSTLDAMAANVCVVDAQGRITLVNRSWREFADAGAGPLGAACEGSSYVELCRSATRHTDSEVRNAAAAILEVLDGRRETCAAEFGCHSPDERRWFIAAAQRFRNASQDFIVVSHTNITARRESEIAAREAEERFRSLTELSSDIYWETDSEYRFTRRDTNSRGVAEHLLPADNILGKRRWELPHASPDAAGWAAHKAMLDARRPIRDFEFSRRTAAGTIRHFSISGEPMFDEVGAFKGYRFVGTDVTASKREARLLSLEHAVTRQLYDAESPSDGLHAVLRAVCEAKDWQFGHYLRVDSYENVLRFEASWGPPGLESDQYSAEWRSVVFSPGVGLAGRVWSTGNPIWVPDVSKDPRVKRASLLHHSGMRGAFLAPVQFDGRIIGVMAFSSRAVREPDERLLQTITVIGVQLGQFLQRKQAQSDAKVHALHQQRLASFGQFALKRRTGDELVSEAISVLSHEADVTALLVRLPDRSFRLSAAHGLGIESVVGQAAPVDENSVLHGVLDNSLPMRVSRDYLRSLPSGYPWSTWMQKMASAIYAPVTQNGHAHGVLALYSARPDAFGDEVTRFAQAIGHSLSTALQREEAERNVAAHALRQQMIALLGQRALSATDLDELFSEGIRIALGERADATALFERQAGPHTYRLRAVRGIESSNVPGVSLQVCPHCPVDEAFRCADPLLVVDQLAKPCSRVHGGWGSAMRSSINVRIEGEKSAFGVLSVFAKAADAFDQDDVKFVQAVANVLSSAVQRIQAGQRLAYLAQFDSLTGLPNRGLLEDRLKQTIAQSWRRQRPAGVLFVDLDRFKLVNDTLGHAIGDDLLREVAARLQASIRVDDTAGRISGDEFAIVLADLAGAEDAAVVAEKILDALARPFTFPDGETFVSASIGISIYPADGEDGETLLCNADMAMYQAKKASRNSYQYFTEQMNERSVAKLQLNTDLRHAVERREFMLHYQPKVDLATGRLVAMEALLRWSHPQRGTVSPADFIPALEDSGLILPVGEWVLDEACAQLVRWQRLGLAPVPVAINLSAKQFRRPDLDAGIQRTLEKAGIPARLIELEITESSLAEDPEDAVRQLENLRAAGIRISIDDFGTGYSSLAYLTRLPLSALKIDRSFVRDCHTNALSASIVRAVINMAHNLSLTVIAEGVETEAQAQLLRLLGCHQAQGYFFGKPVPPERIVESLCRLEVAA